MRGFLSRLRVAVGRVFRLLAWVVDGDEAGLPARDGGRPCAVGGGNLGQSAGMWGGGGSFDDLPDYDAVASDSASSGRGGRASKRTHEEDMTGVKVLDVIAFNAEVEPLAMAFLADWLKRDKGGVRVGAACAELALRYDISTETAKRWVVKHSAPSGRFSSVRGMLTLKVQKKEGEANGRHKPPRRLRGKPLCQQARPKARFPFAGTRRRRGRLDAVLARFPLLHNVFHLL